MSVFAAGAADTNARLVRSLAHALKTNSAICKPLLEHCRSQNAFASILADDAEYFFNSVTGVLNPDNERTSALSLEVLHHTLTNAPPYILRPHWLHVAQRLTSLLKSSKPSQKPRLQAQLLTVMAAVVASASPFPVLQTEMKTAVSKVCQSALFHALRALEPIQNTDYVCKAALCLVFSVLGTAPREVRAVLSQLEAGIRERWLFHRNRSVRSTAALLYAHLLECHAPKTRAKVFGERVSEGCKQLEQVMNLLDMFGPSTGEKRPQLFDDALRELSLCDLKSRVEMACTYIRHMVGMRHDMLMPMPLPTLYRVLLRGIEERHVDAYATVSGVHLLDTDGVLILINTLVSQCAETLVCVTEASGKDATVVFAQQIGQCLEEKLSHVVLRSRSEAGLVSSVVERGLVYRMMAGMVEVMGGGILPYVCGMMAELFSVDVKLFMACSGRDALLVQHSSDMKVDGIDRCRKRKRYQNEQSGQQTSAKSSGSATMHRPLNALDEYCARSASASKQTLQDGLLCVTSVFELRAYISEKVSEQLQKVEDGIAKLLNSGVLLEGVLHAASAAGLSGGSNRMYAEASDLLIVGSRVCAGVLTEHSKRGLRREAKACRSGYESIFHARSAPFCLARRVCDQGEGPERGQEAAVDDGNAMDTTWGGERGGEGETARDGSDTGGRVHSNEAMQDVAAGADEEEDVADEKLTGSEPGGAGTTKQAGGVLEGAAEGTGTTKQGGVLEGAAEGAGGNGGDDVRRQQRGAASSDADTRDKDAAACSRHDGEGERGRGGAQTAVPARAGEGAARADGDMARDHRTAAAAAAAGKAEAAEAAEAADGRQQKASAQVSQPEEEEDEEALIRALNFAPPDTRP